MKKLINLAALSVIVGSLSQTSIAASTQMLTWKSGVHIIHTTHFILKKQESVFLEGILFLGTNRSGLCMPIREIAYFHRTVHDNDTIASYAEIFDGKKLDKNSCAVEKFTTTKKEVSLNYILINDGKTVSAADPSEQNADLD